MVHWWRGGDEVLLDISWSDEPKPRAEPESASMPGRGMRQIAGVALCKFVCLSDGQGHTYLGAKIEQPDHR